MIRKEFFQSCSVYSADVSRCETLWDEIEKAYTSSGRYYHTLEHLDAMMMELDSFRHQFEHWDAVVFATAYHDFVYSTVWRNNELRSAGVAAKRLKSIGCPENLQTICRRLIMATKEHKLADDETNLFIDADMSILGTSVEKYEDYAHRIRQEFNLYPHVAYNSGRKKALRGFLNMPAIFKTKEFAARYEKNARRNIEMEIAEIERASTPVKVAG